MLPDSVVLAILWIAVLVIFGRRPRRTVIVKETAWEYTRAHVASNYARASIDEKEQAGWEICSEIDPRYGSVWMRRPAA